MSPTEFVATALAHYLAYQDTLHLAHDIDELLAPIEGPGSMITTAA